MALVFSEGVGGVTWQAFLLSHGVWVGHSCFDFLQEIVLVWSASRRGFLTDGYAGVGVCREGKFGLVLIILNSCLGFDIGHPWRLLSEVSYASWSRRESEVKNGDSDLMCVVFIMFSFIVTCREYV